MVHDKRASQDIVLNQGVTPVKKSESDKRPKAQCQRRERPKDGSRKKSLSLWPTALGSVTNFSVLCAAERPTFPRDFEPNFRLFLEFVRCPDRFVGDVPPQQVTDPHWLESLEDDGEAKRFPNAV
jgi:hypothetical protein